jgi:hypothetical protein
MSRTRKTPLRPPDAPPTDAPRRRAGRRNRIAALLAMLSLLIQSSLPWPAKAAARGVAGTAPGAPGWAMASLCLAHGSGAPERPARPAPDKPAASCPLCLALDGLGTFVPPPVAPLDRPHASRGIRLAVATAVEHGARRAAASRARAPPAAAI